MAKRRYDYAIRVLENGKVKWAYPRATFTSAVRAYEREIKNYTPVGDYSGIPYSPPTCNTGFQSVSRGDKWCIQFERFDRG